jgi:ABC-type nitrate/sulfonate/bicarbonate transport system substrate-binding protein
MGDEVEKLIPSFPRLMLCLIALAVAVALTACGEDDGDGDRSLKVGYSYGFDVGDTSDRVAFDQMAEDTGIEPVFEELGGTQQAVAALVRGEVDMSKLNYSEAINAIAQGADIRVILSANPALDLLLAGQPEFQTVSDLRGKRIARDSPSPTAEGAQLEAVLEQDGIGEDDYEASYLSDSQERVAALEADRIDAGMLESTDLELTREELGLNRLADLGAGAPDPDNVFVVSGEFAEQNRALLDEVVRGLLDGFESLDGPDGRDLWVQKAQEGDLAGQPEEVAERIYEGHRKIGYWPRGGPYTEAQHEQATKSLADAGVLEEPASFDQVWDISFWRNAAGG